MGYLTIAMAKGRLEKEMIRVLQNSGMAKAFDPKSRKLIYQDEHDRIRYMFVKPVDVVTYVEKGIADLGVVGKDVLLEQAGDVYELMDLKFGRCIFAVAGFPDTPWQSNKPLRIATKYPNITASYFKGRDIEVTYLNGSVELGPLIGLSEVIVDLVETGATLKANGLVVLEEMFEISAKLIGNPASYSFKSTVINEFLKNIGDDNHDLANY